MKKHRYPTKGLPAFDYDRKVDQMWARDIQLTDMISGCSARELEWSNLGVRPYKAFSRRAKRIMRQLRKLKARRLRVEYGDFYPRRGRRVA